MPTLSWKNKTRSYNFPKLQWFPWYQHSASENLLFWGDNGSALQELASKFENKINLIYLDPPFCSAANYHQKIDVHGAPHEQLAYSDNWNEDDYLQFMYCRVLLLKSLLHDTGSIFLHCDPHQSHHLRAILDEIFGANQFRNEIIWHYTGGGRAKKYFSQKHDTIFWYSNSKEWTFNIDEIRLPYAETSGYAKTGIKSRTGKIYFPNPKGKPADDTWDLPIINPMANERNGYPTQKPRKLLDRIILACSNPGEIVLDPFLGSGTTAESAISNQRRFIGIDANINALQCTRKRLLEQNLSDFSMFSSQKISNRKATVQLKQKNDDEWNISEVVVSDGQASIVQYMIVENRKKELQINNSSSLVLSKLNSFTLVFLNGSQAHFQISAQQQFSSNPKLASD